MYSGVFCLLALRGARDWRRAVSIQLQDLQDHHIFPRDYLRNHAVEKRAVVNSITNRTLISDETNGKIKNKAPADYLANKDIFPSGPDEQLLMPHFISAEAIDAMKRTMATSPASDVLELYERFCALREQSVIAEIRRVCGISSAATLEAVTKPILLNPAW